MPSQSVVIDSEHVNAQLFVCTSQLRLYVGYESLPHRHGPPKQTSPPPGYCGPNRINTPDCTGVSSHVIPPPNFHLHDSITKTRTPLNRRSRCTTYRLPGCAIALYAAERYRYRAPR